MKSNPFIVAIVAFFHAFIGAPVIAQNCDDTGLPGVAMLIDNGVIAALESGVTLQQFVSALNQQFPNLNAIPVDQIPGRPIHLVSFAPPPPAQMQVIEDWMQNQSSMLQYHDFLYTSEAPEGHTGSVFVDTVVSAESFANQYVVGQTGLEPAHDRSQGLGSVIAVLDTGIDFSHPQLAGRAAPGGYNFMNYSTATADVGDGADNDGDGSIDEMVGHGTYVAGLISLVAPQSKILPVVVLDSDGVGNNWTITRGVYYAIDRGVEVINLSLGSTYDAEAVNFATEAARDLGIIVVAAAGNLNRNCPRERPAMDDGHGVLGVAAVNDLEVKADFSNFNSRLFISAPGDSTNSGPGGPNLQRSIISAIPVSMGGEYRVWKGTSAATPLLAGAAALIRAQHPQWPANGTTFNVIVARLRDTAVNIYSLNPDYAKDEELGAGRLNIGAATALGPIAPALGDLNNDGVVNINDLLKVINEWGLTHSSADITGDGAVNVNDLLVVINNWG